MASLNERFLQLKADTEELKGIAEMSEIAYKKVQEFATVLGKLNVADEEGKKAYLDGMRKYLDTELDYLRDKTDIIRKVSPKTAEQLEKMINDYDKGTRHVLEVALDKDYEITSPLHAMSELYNFSKTIYSILELRNIVNMVCNGFLDTITYLDGEKSPK